MVHPPSTRLMISLLLLLLPPPPPPQFLYGQVDAVWCGGGAPRKILIIEKVVISGERTEVLPIHPEACYF